MFLAAEFKRKLLTRDLRYSLFHLFASWSGKFSHTIGDTLDRRYGQLYGMGNFTTYVLSYQCRCHANRVMKSRQQSDEAQCPVTLIADQTMQ